MNQISASPYRLVGEETGVRRLVDAFYDAMEREPAFARLRAIHAPDLAAMRARLADFLTGWLGGPRVYAERHPGRPCIFSAHTPFAIDADLADQWMACMRGAFADSGTPEPFRALVDPALASLCANLRCDRY